MRIQGLVEMRTQGLVEMRTQGLGLRIQGLEFRVCDQKVWVLQSKIHKVKVAVDDREISACRVRRAGSGFRVLRMFRVYRVYRV
jgi:hypothetical protein